MNTQQGLYLHFGRTAYRFAGIVTFEQYRSGETAIRMLDEYGQEQGLATIETGVDPGVDGVWLNGWSRNAGVPDAFAAAGIVELTGRTQSIEGVLAQHAKLTDRAVIALMRSRETLTFNDLDYIKRLIEREEAAKNKDGASPPTGVLARLDNHTRNARLAAVRFPIETWMNPTAAAARDVFSPEASARSVWVRILRWFRRGRKQKRTT